MTLSRVWGTAEAGCEGTELCSLLHMAPVPCRAPRTFAASASAPRTATSVGTSTTRMCPRRTGEWEQPQGWVQGSQAPEFPAVLRRGVPACMFAEIAALVGDVQPRPGAFFKTEIEESGMIY